MFVTSWTRTYKFVLIVLNILVICTSNMAYKCIASWFMGREVPLMWFHGLSHSLPPVVNSVGACC